MIYIFFHFQIKEEDESKTSSRNSIDKAVTTITITNGDSDIRNSNPNIAVVSSANDEGESGSKAGGRISDAINNNDDEAVAAAAGGGGGGAVLKEKVTRK